MWLSGRIPNEREGWELGLRKGLLSRSETQERKEHLPWILFAASISSTLVVTFSVTNSST